MGGSATEDGTLRFPDGFRWGVATSAYQCEGVVGKPASTWARWEALGHVRAGNRSGRACDWWDNAERDFDLARDLGLNGLRLSVDWARIEPVIGRFDDAALERYRELVAGLRARGIEPMSRVADLQRAQRLLDARIRGRGTSHPATAVTRWAPCGCSGTWRALTRPRTA